MSYNKLNISIGWLVFLLSTIVYFLTLEETASLWDCGEYITAAYKLEVGHPPGAPFFMIIGRIFSLFAGDVADVALWINRMSALSSSFTILFLFWSITLLGKKIAEKNNATMTRAQEIAIIGSGFVGAMAYTFTESFWFSAVEGEVYAMSSLFTAVIFWAALKWDEEMTRIKRGLLSQETRPLRWMVLIMFLFGLAIGVHLLGLLVLPAIAYIIMYNQREGKEVSIKQFLLTGVIGVVVLGFIQEGIIPGTIALASKMEIFFKNSLGLPFLSGAILFFILLVTLLVAGLIFTQKKKMPITNTAILGLIMLVIGYGSFAVIVIRSNANPPLDENNPENLVTLHAYLKREQYGSWPILYGEWFNSKTKEQKEFGDRSPFYDKRYVITSASGSEVAAFRDKDVAEAYVEDSGKKYDIVHKYFETNKHTRRNQVVDYVHKTIFPRMYFRGDPNRTAGYKRWSGYNPNRRVPSNLIGEDGKPIPTFGDNLRFFFNYQLDWMYWRYFMWNFAGRQNDIQGHGDEMRGNWLSGFNIVDETRLGAQGENAPYFTTYNPSNNKFFFIPLVLGLIGLFFHFVKAPRDAFVVFLLFLFTGIAIVVYLNQKPFEPRERDYAYAASFYTFAIWIGLGVYGLFEAFRSFGKEEFRKLGIGLGVIILFSLVLDTGDYKGNPTLIATLIISLMVAGALALMMGLKKVVKNGNVAAGIATILGLFAPIILGFQGWDDHDRSNRTPARALAWNYLQSCAPNSILYTNGDNDTFPLWYLQEVEGIRTDIRVANLSLMQTDWYTEQMTMRAYESDPLPIKFREDQILMGAGNTDYTLFVDFDIYAAQIGPEKSKEIIQAKIKHNAAAFKRSLTNFRRGLIGAISALTIEDKSLTNVIEQITEELANQLENPGYDDYTRTERIMRKVFADINGGKLSGSRDLLGQLQDAASRWMNDWDYLPLDYAMEFVRDDANMLQQQGGRKLRFFPSSGFILPVNKENAIKAEIVPEAYAEEMKDEVRFNFKKGSLFSSDVRGLSREELMMLDILANFNWSRGIYFSSPGGSDVAKALYREGQLQNLGQVHGLSPLSQIALTEDAQEKITKNVLEVYDYGNMKEDGVLVDYYVRRHTSQYRSSFLDAAMLHMQDYRQAKRDEMQSAAANADSLVGAPVTSNKAEEYADKVEAIVRHAMTELPMDRVLDMGEPRPVGKRLPNGSQIYTDGRLADFIAVLYQVDRVEYGNTIASEYLDQLEMSMNYFEYSPAKMVYYNEEDFIAFCMNFLRTFAEVYSTNEPDVAIVERVMKMEDRLTKQVVPRIVEGLRLSETTEVKNNRSVKRNMKREADDFLALYQALLVENGLMQE